MFRRIDYEITMILATAQRAASKIASELAPFCERIEIAGSIRRQRPNCNDIDLVILPRDLTALRQRLCLRTHSVSDGPEIITVRLANNIQIDVFLAHAGIKDFFNPQPSNWGSVLMCRTGSKEHNVWLCQRAQKFGLKWGTMRGLVDEDGYTIAGATEAEIYEALDLPFIDPINREISFLESEFPSTSPTSSIPAPKSIQIPAPATPARDESIAAALAEFRAWKATCFGPSSHSVDTAHSADLHPVCTSPELSVQNPAERSQTSAKPASDPR
jgi:hypothetical protein